MESRSLRAKANYSRICHLLVDETTNALRNALHAMHPPSTLASVLNANKKTLRRIRYSVIKASQWDLLFPTSGAPDSNNFDITLLTVLLRNICGLSAPATGWNMMPPVSDTSISANILRLQMFRNEVYGHIPTAGLDDVTFETLWNEISVPLVNMGIPENDIDELKMAPLSPEEERYIERLKEWKQQDDLMSKFSDFETEVHNLDVYKDSFVRHKIPNLDDHSRLVDFSQKIDKTPFEKSNHREVQEFKGYFFRPNSTQFKKNTADQLTEANGTLMKKDNFSEFSGTSLKDGTHGSRPSLVEKNFSLSDEVTTVKHREKIMLLKAKDCNELRETKIPLKFFLEDEALKIGNGSSGTNVYVGLMENGREVAVKKIIKATRDLLAQNELEIFRLTKDIRSPYIVNYWYFDADDFYMYLVIDLCEENLKKYVVETCSLEYLRKHGVRMIEEILLGLQVLHDKGILHRDLKPSNILVSVDGRMQLADFGISRVLNDDETTVLTAPKGTDGWMPPEVIEQIVNEGSKGRYKRKSDMHAAGMIAFFILTKGEHPFGPRLERMSNISKGKPIFLDKVTALTAQQFISELISHNIDHRPYVEDALKHCFFKEQSQSIVHDN